MAKVDHPQLVSSLMKEMHSIKLDRHCLICFKEENSNVIRQLVSSNPKGIDTFEPLMHYITGTRHAEETSSETGSGTMPTAKQIPTLCSKCYDLTSALSVLHQQLLDVQLKIQVKTELVRSVVKRTKEKGASGEQSLLWSNVPASQIRSAKGFLSKLYNQIMDAGKFLQNIYLTNNYSGQN